MRESSKVPVLKPWRSVAFAAASLVVAAAAAAPADTAWRTQLTERGRTASATITEDGYSLSTVNEGRAIPAQTAKTETASVLFDALFALAQDELGRARVEEIRYSAFNDNQPVPCECLVAGQLWPWVWTRDIAYATDLGVFRFDPLSARNSLEFKLSTERADHGEIDPRKSTAARSTYIVQDTGSGGSWPVSTDRISWFLGARHLLGNTAFADKVYKALVDTLAQDLRYVFDADRGLYRGETSFLDWREQTYPGWTAHDVTFIAESYALSTNVLYFEALQLAATMAQARHADPAPYRKQALALKVAIDNAFWREDRGMYMSYVGNANSPRNIEAYDLLGTSLAIISGVAPPARARRALAGYPTWSDGTPAVWPEREEVQIYHNRAIWPFASAYALKAARALDEPARIAHELRSMMRHAALAGSNMENFELHIAASRDSGPAGMQSPEADLGNFDFPKARGSATPLEQAGPQRATEVDRGDFALPKPDSAAAGGAPSSPEQGPGPKTEPAHGTLKKIPRAKETRSNEPKRSGPAINSRRQLWSIGAYLDLVVEGVFGLTDRGTIEPKLPRELMPMVFGERKEIQLTLADRRITLIRPAQLKEDDNLLIAGTTSGTRAETRVQLRAVHVESSPLPLGRPVFAAQNLAAPTVERDGEQWRIHGAAPASAQLYVNERSVEPFNGTASVPYGRELQCISLTARSRDGVESLPSKPVCVGESNAVGGDWPRAWTAQHDGRYQLRVDYNNPHGPIMTGVTAAVKMMVVQCAGAPLQSAALVMPHSEGRQQSTAVAFDARAGQRCTFTLDDGFNMSYLAHYAKFTAGDGGVHGAVNTAEIGDMHISPQR
jgi:hypothetical protein